MTWLLILAVVSGGIVAVSNPQGVETGEGIDSVLEWVQDVSAGVGNATDSNIDEGDVEESIVREINDRRADRGLSTLATDGTLREMGRAHSADMADRDYFSHVSPDGVTIEDRYRERGILDQCKLPAGDRNEYYPGAEIIAQSWVYTQVEGDDGDTERYTTADGLAVGIVEQWMNSPGHQAVMLLDNANEVGVGVEITSENKVYASAEFC